MNRKQIRPQRIKTLKEITGTTRDQLKKETETQIPQCRR
jgi:hypothetical protein